MRDRLVPGGADLLDRTAHADRIDLRRGRQRAHRHRHVEAAPVGADHIGEQEGAALVLVEAALELPAHQRVKLGVLVDLAVDAHQEPGGIEPRQVLLEVGRRAASLGGGWSGRSLVRSSIRETFSGGGSLAIQADGVSGNK